MIRCILRLLVVLLVCNAFMGCRKSHEKESPPDSRVSLEEPNPTMILLAREELGRVKSEADRLKAELSAFRPELIAAQGEELARLKNEAGRLKAELKLFKVAYELQEQERVKRERRLEEKEKGRLEREQRDREDLQRALVTLCRLIEAQKRKDVARSVQAAVAGERAGQPIPPRATDDGDDGIPSQFDPVKLAVEAMEKKAREALERANEKVTADGGSVRRARAAWRYLIVDFPESSAAREAAKYLFETEDLLNAENEKGATKALKDAYSAYCNGGIALARLRYRNIVDEFPTTQAAKEAQKMFNKLRQW